MAKYFILKSLIYYNAYTCLTTTLSTLGYYFMNWCFIVLSNLDMDVLCGYKGLMWSWTWQSIKVHKSYNDKMW